MGQIDPGSAVLHRPLPIERARSSRKQAQVPTGAEVFPNPRGTAPGIALEDEEKGLCILLPGPPDELAALLSASVVPYLAARVKAGARRPYRRLLRTAGIAESAIAEKVGERLDDLGLDVAYLPEVEGNDVRLTGWAVSEDQIGPALDEGVRRLHDIDKSGWWLLAAFIPLIGWLVLLYFYVQPSQPGANRFGGGSGGAGGAGGNPWGESSVPRVPRG